MSKLIRRLFNSRINKSKSIYIPISYKISNLTHKVNKKSLFKQLKTQLNIPIKGIRQNTEEDYDKNIIKTTYLADALYINEFPSSNSILEKEFSLKGNSSLKFKIDFSQNTKDMIKLSKTEGISPSSKEYRAVLERLNEEVVKFRIKNGFKMRKFGKKAKNSGKNLSEILKEPALQFLISKKSPVRVYRNRWLRNGYEEPCYFTILKTKFKKHPKTSLKAAYGVLTWRGKSTNKIQKIPSAAKREWRYIKDPQTIALDPRQNPFFTPSNRPPYPKSTFLYKIINSLSSLPRDKSKKELRNEWLERQRLRLEARKEEKKRDENSMVKKALEYLGSEGFV